MSKKFTPADLERMRSIAVNMHGRSGDRVKNYRMPDGAPAKAVTDELGNTVTQHHESQDVEIRPETLRMKAQPLLQE
jgi:hypothetical protein